MSGILVFVNLKFSISFFQLLNRCILTEKDKEIAI